MKKQKPQPQPPVFTEVQKFELARMDKFRKDMADLETDRTEIEHKSAYAACKHDPLTFKYLHAQFLYKVWRAGGDSNE